MPTLAFLPGIVLDKRQHVTNSETNEFDNLPQDFMFFKSRLLDTARLGCELGDLDGFIKDTEGIVSWKTTSWTAKRVCVPALELRRIVAHPC